MAIEVKRMWDGGPLRQWSATRPLNAGGNWVRYQSRDLDGYAGAYVCDGCRMPCRGVYFVQRVSKWLCKACKGKV